MNAQTQTLHSTQLPYLWYPQQVRSRYHFLASDIIRFLSDYLLQLQNTSLNLVPMQTNGCDCGVFICRYAYNLYMMRNLQFTKEHQNEKPPFSSLITSGSAFQFNMSDIARIRVEMVTLIDNLSQIYQEFSSKKIAHS